MSLMIKLLWIGAGGFCGAISRYLWVGVFHKAAKVPWLPTGTLGVNVLGCFLIGLIGGFVENKNWLSPELRSLIIIGFLGSFTTFSTFGFESLAFFRDHDFLLGGMNIILHLIVGFIAVYLGYQMTVS